MDYDTWVFFDGGYLQEVIAEPGEDPEWLGASPIAGISSLSLAMDEKVVKYEIKYGYGSATRVMKSRMVLRSRSKIGFIDWSGLALKRLPGLFRHIFIGKEALHAVR
jgi:hypothetical protein